MVSFLSLIPIALIILIFLWPPILILYFLIALYPIGLILVHKFGNYVPHWTFGANPSHDINIYFRTKEARKCALQYKTQGIDNWYSQYQCKFSISSRNTPIIIENKNGDALELQSKTKTHYFMIKNLHAATEYEYRIVDIETDDVLFGKGKFRTQSDNPDPNFSFAVYGDMQIGENLEIIESYFTYLIRKNNPELLLAMGDNWHKYEIEHDWNVYHTILRKIIPYIPYYNTPGNHDYGRDEGKSLALDAMNFPINRNNDWYYSFQYKKAMFISLSSRKLHDKVFQKEQKEFLERELQRANELKNQDRLNWVIFYTHIPWYGPPYNKKRLHDQNEEFIIANWVPIFEKYGVDLFFAGHKHSYCRDGNKIITASMHGVRHYEEQFDDDYVVQNSHQYCKVDVSKSEIKVYVKTWLNRNIEIYSIKKRI